MSGSRLAKGRPDWALGFADETQRRLRAYREALAAAGYPPDPALVRIGVLSERVGEQLVEDLLALPTHPDAVFIGNNRLAAGALHAPGKANAARASPIAIAAFYDSAALSAYAPAHDASSIASAASRWNRGKSSWPTRSW